MHSRVHMRVRERVGTSMAPYRWGLHTGGATAASGHACADCTRAPRRMERHLRLKV